MLVVLGHFSQGGVNFRESALQTTSNMYWDYIIQTYLLLPVVGGCIGAGDCKFL